MRHLDAGEIHRAYPLVQAAYADLSADDWVRYAGVQVAGGGAPLATGIMVAEDSNAYLHGLFSYAIVENSLSGRVLHCDHLVVLHLFSAGQPLAALVEAAGHLGASHRCVQVQLCVPTPAIFPETVQSPVLERLRRVGFDCESVRFRAAASIGKVGTGNAASNPTGENSR